MTAVGDQTGGRVSWRFPRTFWMANGAELFERAAYYGMAIALAVYLTDKIGFTDIQTGYVAAVFASVLYLLPTFTGIMADRMGFRRALLLAFACLTVGYALLGVAGLPADLAATRAVSATAPLAAPADLLFAELPRKLIVLAALGIIMFGGAIVKPVISGTVAKCSDAVNRARAFSIFYAVVNIGAFSGKALAYPLRIQLGLEYINFYAALMALCALFVIWAGYRDVDRQPAGKTYREVLAGLLRVMANVRFLSLILIIAGFWTIQHQLYASMPKYIFRMVGPQAAPEWLANVNPAVVVLLVVPITHLVARWLPVNSIIVALLIIPFSALAMSLSPLLQAGLGTANVAVLGVTMHVITLLAIIGIALQGVGECFLSPKFLEYASKQAPPGETGMYMGYMHLTSFFAYFLGFAISGHLLDGYCPDPKTLPPDVQAQRELALASGGAMPAQYARAHYIWYVFSGIGATALLAMLVFKYVTTSLDRRRAEKARLSGRED